MEADVLKRINTVRTGQGLGALRENAALTRLARAYSREMAVRNFFDHTSPSGVTLQDRVMAAGLRYQWIGENLFKSYNEPESDLAEIAVKGWMNSPGHRANILRPQFTETGVGIWKSGRTVYFTQEFFHPR